MDSSGVSLKGALLSANKFTNVAVLNLLQQLKFHTSRIHIYGQVQDYEKVSREQIEILRKLKEIKFAIEEIENLRTKINDEGNREKFDEIILKGKNQINVETSNAFNDIRDCVNKMRLVNATDHDDDDDDDSDIENFQIVELKDNKYLTFIGSDFNREEYLIYLREVSLHDHRLINRDIEILYDCFKAINELVSTDSTMHIDPIVENADEVFEDVVVTEKNRRSNFTVIKKIIVPTLGSCIGGIIAGPFGAVVGFKTSALVVAGGGIIGATTGNILNNVLVPKLHDIVEDGEKVN